MPRARVRDEETGETTEFRSELLPRYTRRTREVDEAILGPWQKLFPILGWTQRVVPLRQGRGFFDVE